MNEEKLRALKPRFPFNRGSHGRCVLLAGDSIFRGFGTGRYDYPNLLNRIDDIGNSLVEENGPPSGRGVHFYYLFTQDPAVISAFAKANQIQPGDMVVYEDAGPHEDNLNLRHERLNKLQEAILAIPSKPTLLLTTTFDFNPQPNFYNSYYNAWIGESQVTMNDVLKESAGRTHEITWTGPG